MDDVVGEESPAGRRSRGRWRSVGFGGLGVRMGGGGGEGGGGSQA